MSQHEPTLHVSENLTQLWKLPNGELHRDGKPAVVTVQGNAMWYSHGQIHREDGPAVEQYDGKIFLWYLWGQPYNFDEWIHIVDLDERTKTLMRLRYSGT